MKSRQLYKIGEVSKKARVTLRTVRYYEELGLIQPIVRTKGGFRLYTEESVGRLEFIQGLKLLDLPLAKIKEMLQIRGTAQSGDEASHRMMQLLQRQRAEATQRKKQYEKMLREIHTTMEVVRECYGCVTKPSHESCRSCTVISHRVNLPLPIKVLL